MTFHIIIPTDELIFFRGAGIPPTRIHLHAKLRDFVRGKKSQTIQGSYGYVRKQVIHGYMEVS